MKGNAYKTKVLDVRPPDNKARELSPRQRSLAARDRRRAEAERRLARVTGKSEAQG